MPEWIDHLRPRLAPLALSGPREAEIIEELSQHLDQRYEELRADGASDADAQRIALEELLDRDALANHMRSLRQAHVPPAVVPGAPSRFLLADLWQDVGYAGRTLLKQPGFTLTAVVTLAPSALARIDPALLAKNGPLKAARGACSMGGWSGNDRAVSVAGGSSSTRTSGLVNEPARQRRARWPGGRRPKPRGADAILTISPPTVFSVAASSTKPAAP